MTYATEDLIDLPVEDPFIHSLYVTPDRRYVFVVRVGRDGVNVHRARGYELERLAARTGLLDLAEARRHDQAEPPAAPD